MTVRRAGSVVGVGMILLTGCAGSAGETSAPSATTPTTTVVDLRPTSPPSTAVTVTIEPTITTTTIDGPDPACAVTVDAGDSLSHIADEAAIELDALRAENWLADDDVIHPGDRLDVCVDNDIDDVTGASRLAPAPAAVRRQQEHLNDLFEPYRFADLVIDGDSGPLTRQLLCAARMGLGMQPAATHLPAGSNDEATVLAATKLAVPEGAATWRSKWILIDNTCQVLFIGEGEQLVDIYPTSTGSPGFETRRTQGVEAFRFDPALDNDGWHDSSRFPTSADDPQNGNMYKPIYFNNGQAIHGANYVPPEPRSKGCARTFPHHQDELLAWLGLTDVTEATWRREEIGVTVTVQGDFRPAP